MKYSWYACGLILVFFSLAGCGKSESTATKQGRSETAAPESVFDPMIQTMDKAKTVENLSLNRTSELDKELEKSQ